MNIEKKKDYIISLIVMLMLSIILIGFRYYKRTGIDDGYIRPALNYKEIFKCIDSEFEDEININTIISNLPGNEFYIKSSSIEEDGHKIINIYYDEFKEIDVKSPDNKYAICTSSKIFEKNITVVFALVNDVDIVNVHRGDSRILRYTRNEAKYSYAKGNLEDVIKDKEKLGRFYDLWVG